MVDKTQGFITDDGVFFEDYHLAAMYEINTDLAKHLDEISLDILIEAMEKFPEHVVKYLNNKLSYDRKGQEQDASDQKPDEVERENEASTNS